MLACLACNKHKADRTPEQAGMRLPQGAGPTDVATAVRGPRDVRIESWSKFVSEAYWNVELEK